jgi:hypothetical protein
MAGTLRLPDAVVWTGLRRDYFGHVVPFPLAL